MANASEVKDNAAEASNSHKRAVGLGAGMAAALLSVGFLAGKKREQNRSAYHKIKDHLNL